jgi:small subunit ribosomal protein S21
MYNNNRKPSWKRDDRDRMQGEVHISPLEVDVRNNDIEQALKVLKNKLAKDGILAELKERRHAEKPSEKKRRKHREALRKLRSKKSKSRKFYQNNNKKNTSAKKQ